MVRDVVVGQVEVPLSTCRVQCKWASILLCVTLDGLPAVATDYRVFTSILGHLSSSMKHWGPTKGIRRTGKGGMRIELDNWMLSVTDDGDVRVAGCRPARDGDGKRGANTAAAVLNKLDAGGRRALAMYSLFHGKRPL